jgi:excisionase family DNA binding protein
VTALHHLPPALTAEAWRLQAPLLRLSEAAELPSVRPSWVYEVARTSLLTYWRVGRRIPFTRQMLEAWLEAQHHA